MEERNGERRNLARHFSGTKKEGTEALEDLLKVAEEQECRNLRDIGKQSNNGESGDVCSKNRRDSRET